jgi:hypothetical protein
MLCVGCWWWCGEVLTEVTLKVSLCSGFAMISAMAPTCTWWCVFQLLSQSSDFRHLQWPWYLGKWPVDTLLCIRALYVEWSMFEVRKQPRCRPSPGTWTDIRKTLSHPSTSSVPYHISYVFAGATFGFFNDHDTFGKWPVDIGGRVRKQRRWKQSTRKPLWMTGSLSYNIGFAFRLRGQTYMVGPSPSGINLRLPTAEIITTWTRTQHKKFIHGWSWRTRFASTSWFSDSSDQFIKEWFEMQE